jgi:hypothetical protein
MKKTMMRQNWTLEIVFFPDGYPPASCSLLASWLTQVCLSLFVLVYLDPARSLVWFAAARDDLDLCVPWIYCDASLEIHLWICYWKNR